MKRVSFAVVAAVCLFVSLAGSAEACCGGGGFCFLGSPRIMVREIPAPQIDVEMTAVANHAVAAEQRIWSLMAEQLRHGLLGLVR